MDINVHLSNDPEHEFKELVTRVALTGGRSNKGDVSYADGVGPYLSAASLKSQSSRKTGVLRIQGSWPIMTIGDQLAPYELLFNTPPSSELRMRAAKAEKEREKMLIVRHMQARAVESDELTTAEGYQEASTRFDPHLAREEFADDKVYEQSLKAELNMAFKFDKFTTGLGENCRVVTTLAGNTLVIHGDDYSFLIDDITWLGSILCVLETLGGVVSEHMKGGVLSEAWRRHAEKQVELNGFQYFQSTFGEIAKNVSETSTWPIDDVFVEDLKTLIERSIRQCRLFPTNLSPDNLYYENGMLKAFDWRNADPIELVQREDNYNQRVYHALTPLIDRVSNILSHVEPQTRVHHAISRAYEQMKELRTSPMDMLASSHDTEYFLYASTHAADLAKRCTYTGDLPSVAKSVQQSSTLTHTRISQFAKTLTSVDVLYAIAKEKRSHPHTPLDAFTHRFVAKKLSTLTNKQLSVLESYSEVSSLSARDVSQLAQRTRTWTLRHMLQQS